jgi:hypothetical protein
MDPGFRRDDGGEARRRASGRMSRAADFAAIAVDPAFAGMTGKGRGDARGAA